jgi:hypothetical protein
MIAKTNSKSSSIDQFLLRLQPEQIVDLCGGLLTFRDGVFDVVHGSVIDFLSRPVECWLKTEKPSIQIFQNPFYQSHATLGDVCVRYLTEVDCSQIHWEQAQSLQDLEFQPPLLRYACSYAV